MNTFTEVISSSFEVKGSKFLAFLLPFEVFENTLIELKVKHPKATHFVYAYRTFRVSAMQKIQAFKKPDLVIQNPNQVIERFSDDGEPRGSSGMPVLNVLRGENFVDSAAVVVRYFGGTLLGIGGLARAYTQSVLVSLKLAKDSKAVVPFEFSKSIDFECPYPLLNRIEYFARTLGATLSKDVFDQDFVKLKLTGSTQIIERFLTQYERGLKFRI